jgi:GT2 family glycosyltransferase
MSSFSYLTLLLRKKAASLLRRLSHWVRGTKPGRMDAGGGFFNRKRHHYHFIHQLPSTSQLMTQSLWSAHGAAPPRLVFLIPCSEATKAAAVAQSLDSLLAQSYHGWEAWVMQAGESLALPEDERIHRVSTMPAEVGEENRWISWLWPGDNLRADACFLVATYLQSAPDTDLLYTDENVRSNRGSFHSPYFKPGWSPESLLSRPYLGDLVSVKAEKLARLPDELQPWTAQPPYALLLALSEAPLVAIRLPEILYHRRRPLDLNPSGGAGLIRQALLRRGLKGEALAQSGGGYRLNLCPTRSPLISLIIPTRDHPELLQACLSSVFGKSSYPNFEVVLVDNRSQAGETLRLFEDWQGRYPGRIRVVEADMDFNFSALINLGRAHCRGDYLLILNDDTEVITPDWMERLLAQAERPEIGLAGPKLLYPDGRIQSAGTVLGLWQSAAHAFQFAPADTNIYFNQAQLLSNYLAMTAACLMLRSVTFDAIGGFDEAFVVNYNDVDFSLRVGQKGYRHVYVPEVVLFHHESPSRHSLLLAAHQEAEMKTSVSLLRQRWGDAVHQDPYYHPLLSRTNPLFPFHRDA